MVRLVHGGLGHGGLAHVREKKGVYTIWLYYYGEDEMDVIEKISAGR